MYKKKLYFYFISLINILMKTFIKYCGGKARLLSYIIENLPNNKFNNYFEPFVGGGSVILGFISKDLEYKVDRIYNISDINKNLINCYLVIRDNVQELIQELSKVNEDNINCYRNEKHVYLEKRKRFNEIKSSQNNLIEQTALFIYLNKCGYNGMYRENKSGGFNIPYGNMKNPRICDNTLLVSISHALQHVNISHCEYQTIINKVEKDDFVYLDPPYDGTFTDYTSDTFGREQQLKLKEFVDTLTNKGVKVMLSNSASDYIKDIYKDYNIVNLTIKYSLGGKNANRGDKQEVLVKNY